MESRSGLKRRTLWKNRPWGLDRGPGVKIVQRARLEPAEPSPVTSSWGMTFSGRHLARYLWRLGHSADGSDFRGSAPRR